MCDTSWVLETHFVYYHLCTLNILISTEKVNIHYHTWRGDREVEKEGRGGVERWGVGGSLTLLILCIAAYKHAAIQTHILKLNAQYTYVYRRNSWKIKYLHFYEKYEQDCSHLFSCEPCVLTVFGVTVSLCEESMFDFHTKCIQITVKIWYFPISMSRSNTLSVKVFFLLPSMMSVVKITLLQCVKLVWI